MMPNSNEGRAIPYQGGSKLLGAQRGCHKYAAANEVTGVLNIPGDLADSVQANDTTAGTEGERTGGQEGTSEVP